MTDDLNHRCFQYQLRLNVDTNPFDDKECGKGLYFCSLENVPHWCRFGSKLAFVSIPDDTKVIHFRNKSKADCIYIEKIDLKNWEMWKNEEFCEKAVNKIIKR